MILFRIALRNIVATKVRTLVIGLLIVFGTALVVVGGSLLSTLDLTMSKSIIGSVAGHLQIYAKDARDKLEFFGLPTGTPNLGRIENFAEVKRVIEDEMEEVEAVVPMGSDFATVFSGNIMDIKLAEMRKAMEAGNRERVHDLAEQVRRIVSLLEEWMDNVEALAGEGSEAAEAEESFANLAIADSDEFWRDFDENQEEKVTFLENKIAKLAMDEKMLFLRYIGTDTEAFQQNFELFEIEKGEMIPPGKRGFLFSDFMYELQVKHQIGMRLDLIKDWLDAGKTIADDKVAYNKVKQNVRQYKDIVFQLDGPSTREVSTKLRELLDTEEADPVELVKQFLDMNDDNFYQRYDFFYEHIAPHIILYQVKIGDILTIRAFTRSGYSTAVNVKVYGTYRFKGMEKSALAGAYSLMDMMTFRDLYGHLTADKKEELAEIKKEAGAAALDRESAEDALFGDDASITEEVEDTGFDEFAGIDMTDGGVRFDEELLQRVYTKAEIHDGVTINASVVLKEGTDVAAAKTRLEGVVEKHGLAVQVIDWREAAGLVGQFIGVIWIVLVTAILIIFLVALVIINNSMVMATLDRTREIGTMRAIGAQRRYILKMFLIESAVLGVGFGIVGTLVGTGIVLLLAHFGIPAFTDALYFLFAGPSLHPILLPGHLLLAFVVVFLVSVASTLYPARLATRILPVKAMGKED